MTQQDVSNLRINADRLWGSLMELAKIGGTEKGGVCRIEVTALPPARQGQVVWHATPKMLRALAK